MKKLQPYTLSGTIPQYCYRVNSNGWHHSFIEVRSSSGDCWITKESYPKEDIVKLLEIFCDLKVHDRDNSYFDLSDQWRLFSVTDVWFDRCCDNLSFSVTAATKEKVEIRSKCYLDAIAFKKEKLEVTPPTKMRDNLWYLYGKLLK